MMLRVSSRPWFRNPTHRFTERSADDRRGPSDSLRGLARHALEEDTMRMSLVLGVVVAAFLISSPVLKAQGDPTVGKWKLNLAKSKYEPGPAPRSETRTYETSGANGIQARFDRVDAAGKTLTITYDAQYDGKDVAYTGAPDADTIALKRVDARTMDATLKKNRKVVQATHAVTSADGKTRTLTTTGTNAQGQKINNTVVFDRL
jgi:hypothetical protein